MANIELAQYVQTQKAQGVPEKEIRATLNAQGWGEEDIDRALAETTGTGSTPLAVKIIGWLIFLGGLLQGFGALTLLALGGLFGSTVIFLGAISLLIAVGMIVVSFGLRRMRRWALYTMTILTILGVGLFAYQYATVGSFPAEEGITALIQAGTVVYFWSIQKKFV